MLQYNLSSTENSDYIECKNIEKMFFIEGKSAINVLKHIVFIEDS